MILILHSPTSPCLAQRSAVRSADARTGLFQGAILRLLTDINELWNREGFGSNDAGSEPLKRRVEKAIRELKGED